MGGTILVAGAINTDLVAYVDRAPDAGETVTGQSFEMHGGGKGANQAVASARAGASVVMLGGVGQDAFGSARTTDLADEGIDTSRIQRFDDVPSGVALITVESTGENRIAYIPAATRSVAPEHARQVVEDVSPRLVLAANELSTACHEAVFSWAKEREIPVVFNVAPYSHDARDVLHLVDVLIVNRVEARALLGEPDISMASEELGRALMALGVANVVITLGGDGVVGISSEGTLRIEGRKMDVVDTTGAGDTFCGAFSTRLLEGATFKEALTWGNIAGALAVTRRGAQSSIPTRDDIRNCLEKGAP